MVGGSLQSRRRPREDEKTQGEGDGDSPQIRTALGGFLVGNRGAHGRKIPPHDQKLGRVLEIRRRSGQTKERGVG